MSFACFFHFIHFSARVVVWHSTFTYIFLVTDGGAPFCILAIWISFLEICPSFCSFVYQVYYLLGNFFMICAYTLSILGAIPLLDVCNLNNFFQSVTCLFILSLKLYWARLCPLEQNPVFTTQSLPSGSLYMPCGLIHQRADRRRKKDHSPAAAGPKTTSQRLNHEEEFSSQMKG